MKIDYLGKEMNIRFDKIPRFIYVNEDGVGCGQVYLDGKRIKPLHSVKINAHTNDGKGVHPLMYSVKYLETDKDHPVFKIIGPMGNGPEVSVKITDTPVFKGILDILKEIMNDESIPEDLRNKYLEKLAETIIPQNIIRDGNGIIKDFYMEGENL